MMHSNEGSRSADLPRSERSVIACSEATKLSSRISLRNCQHNKEQRTTFRTKRTRNHPSCRTFITFGDTTHRPHASKAPSRATWRFGRPRAFSYFDPNCGPPDSLLPGRGGTHSLYHIGRREASFARPAFRLATNQRRCHVGLDTGTLLDDDESSLVSVYAVFHVTTMTDQ